MGVKIVSREYGNPYTVGKTTFPKSNILDWNSNIIEIDVSVHNDYTIESLLSFSRANHLLNTSNVDWKSQGFYNGLAITIEYDIYISGLFTLTSTLNRTIVDIQGNEFEYSGGDITPLHMTNMPGERSVDNGSGTYVPFEYKNVKVYADVQPKELLFEFGFLTNNNYASANLASFVDGTIRNYKVEGVNSIALAGTASMIIEGRQSGMAIENPILRYVSKVGHVYKYKVEFDVQNNSLFDSDLSSIENNIFPDVLLNDDCLTDNFKAKFLPLAGDPNVSITNDMLLTKILGNTGFQGESFNGGIDPYTIIDVAYTDL